MIEASCHCGAVGLQVPHAPEEVKECNCSICRRNGALMAYYSPKDVRLRPESGATDIYVAASRDGGRVRTFMDKRPALGKGLSALIPDAPEPRLSSVEVDVDRISPNQFQPRTFVDEARLDELAQSIKSNGVVSVWFGLAVTHFPFTR